MRVAAAHRLERLADSGPVILRGRFDLPKLDRRGQTTTWLAWPDRWRVDEAIGEVLAASTAFDGAVLRQVLGGKEAMPLEGLAAELTAENSSFRLFGDWRALGIPIQVVQRLRRDDEEAVIVRLGAPEALATTLYVDWGTGLVRSLAGFTFLDGIGRTGLRVSFSDHREVGGAMLPWQTESELAHPLIGTIESVVEKVELGSETPAGLFELRD